MMGQPRMGNSLATITSNQEQAAPGSQGRAVGVRNFLVGTPANEEDFNKNGEANDTTKYETWAKERLASGELTAEGVENLTKELELRKKAAEEEKKVRDLAAYENWANEQITSGRLSAEGVATLNKELELRRGGRGVAEQQESVEVSQIQETSPVSPERAREALDRLEKVKANRGGFLKGLRERMGVAQDKMEAVAAKVGKALDAYNKLEPKTKLMIGLSSCAAGIALGAGGAPLLASVVGVVRLTTKLASTKAVYDGLSGMLDKKYAELDNVSETRKKFMKLGALATATFVNFGLTDALNNTGITDKMVGALDKLGGMMSAVAAPLPVDTMGNPVATADNEGWIIGSTGNQEASIAKDPWLEKGPGEGGVYTPGQQPLPVDAGLDPKEEVIKPGRIPSVPATPSSITPSVISTPSFGQNPAYGFDAASAPPVGSVESFDKNGNLQGWTLPDGSFMKPDGTVSAPGVQAITPVDWKDSVAEGERTVYSQNIITETSPVRDKFDLGVEESFVKPLVEEKLSPAQPQTNTWSTNEGKLLSSDGSAVTGGGDSSIGGNFSQNSSTLNGAPSSNTGNIGGNSPAIEGNAVNSNGATLSQNNLTTAPALAGEAGDSSENSSTLTGTPSGNTGNLGSSSIGTESRVIETGVATGDPAQPAKINLAIDRDAVANDPIIKTLTSNTRLMTVLEGSATEVEDAKAWSPFSRGKGSLPSMKNFLDILHANPNIKVNELLSFDPSKLSKFDKEMVIDAKAILARTFPAEMLANADTLNSKIVEALQNKYK